jgi:hypothetical protein
MTPDYSTPLEAKLEIFDRYAHDAVRDLIGTLAVYAEDLVVLARGRHVDGHYRYGDRNFLEWDDGEMLAQQMQELADAIVYGTQRRHRATVRGNT